METILLLGKKRGGRGEGEGVLHMQRAGVTGQDGRYLKGATNKRRRIGRLCLFPGTYF